ncbi:uncharacterized protein LOC135163969 [Diachasmimorpha longicaudata]|uniref:uncharacterized protein LOC135163969 n=1 Tax=Diachasmimorpha longicaudata TaxID=58733 RepID=UPI0030B8D4A4
MTAATAATWLTLALVVEGLLGEEVILSVNTKKPLAITSEKFLSFTLDPTDILTSNFITDNPERCVNMARALSPAYVRIAGPRSNSYTFARAHTMQEEDPSFIFTETQWNTLNWWTMNSGLDMVAAVAPQQHSEVASAATRDAVWDSRNVLDLISFSDHMGYNISWQLGYECQTRCDISGGDLGKDVMRLRSMLEAFPRFARSIIVGPDVVTFKTRLQQLYLQEYLNAGAGGLSAITWHPDFASISLDPAGVSMHHDNLAVDKDLLYRVIGRTMSKKPLWLAESKPEKCKKQFLGALVWTRRLGNSAKLGAQVLMRQPQESNLFEATPDYWVSVLYKTLVGRQVLDTKIATGNRTHLHFYCQCTRPSSKYEKGSLTVFGINLTPIKLAVSLKGLKIKTLHKYILLPGLDVENRMFSETVLLNNEPLKLQNGKDMPEINPVVATSPKGLSMKLPSGGIGFWVIPDLKVKFCEGHENDNIDKMVLKKLAKRLGEFESTEDNTNEDLESEEIADNSDERWPLIRASRRRWRKSRYSTEDDEAMRYKKLDAKRDLQRLEKLLRWRENMEGKRPLTLRGKPAVIGFEDNTSEINDDASAEEIRTKLLMYKRRLNEYEARKRNFLRLRDKQTPGEIDPLDNERIGEAMRLISKLENAVKNLDGTQNSLNVGNEITAGLNSTNAEEHFLDELLKTRKIKRTSVPEKIEEQLNAIYEMLAEEKERRQRQTETKLVENVKNETVLRSKRDVDKKFGDDPLGLRKTSFYTRRRNLNEEVKERILEKLRRRGEKKDFLTIDRRNQANSNENNFYGFAKRDPLPGFPKGNVYFVTGTSSEEKRNQDYYYIDDKGPYEGGRRKKSRNTGRMDHQETEPWTEDDCAEVGYIPKEFLEVSPLAYPMINDQPKKHEELFEAEARADDAPNHPELEEDDSVTEKILREKPRNEAQDKQTKERVIQKLKGYYGDTGSLDSEEDDMFAMAYGKTGRNSPQRVQKSQEPLMKNGGKTSVQSTVVDDLGALNPHRPVVPSAELASSPRFDQGSQRGNKRFRRDIDSVLDREMIFQDENNLKDCQCRVIRGLRDLSHPKCEFRRRFLERIQERRAKNLAKRERRLRNRERNRRDIIVKEYESDSQEDYEDDPEVDERVKAIVTVVEKIPRNGEEVFDDSVDFDENSEYDDDTEDIADKLSNDFEPYVRLDRDSASPSTFQSQRAVTVPTTNPPTTTTKRRLQNQKNVKKTARTLEKSSKRSPVLPKLSENVPSKNLRTKPIEPTNSPLPEIQPERVSPQPIEETSPELEIKATTLSPVLQSENGKILKEIEIEGTTTERSANMKPDSLEKPEPMKKSMRPARKIPLRSKIKSLDTLKAAGAHSIARSQALVAIKTSDLKRKLKPLESPSKILAAEAAKHQALHQKRLEELEKLKEKLRIKRKNLQDSIQLGDLGKSSDNIAKVVKRREIMQLLKEEQELQSIVDKGKWDYVMLYKPIDYASLPKMSSGEHEPMSKYIPEYTEVVTPLHETRERRTNPGPASNYQRKSSILTYTDENPGDTETRGTQFILGENSFEATAESLEDPGIHEYPMLLTTSDEFSTAEPEDFLNEEVTPDAKSNRGDRRSRLSASKNNDEKLMTNGNTRPQCTHVKEERSEALPEELNTPLNSPLEENQGSPSNFSRNTRYDGSKYVRLVTDKLPSKNEKQNNKDLHESLNVDEALDSSKHKLMMVPLKNQKRQRGRREVGNAIKRTDSENEVWGNAIKLSEMEQQKFGHDSLDIYTSVDISRIKPITMKPEKVIQEDPLSSLIEEAIPKIGDVVTNGLGKAQNVTGSIEKLINEFEETQNEAEYVDEKAQFQEAIKNNPDGLLTHDFFSETTRNTVNFFNLLRGMAHTICNYTPEMNGVVENSYRPRWQYWSDKRCGQFGSGSIIIDTIFLKTKKKSASKSNRYSVIFQTFRNILFIKHNLPANDIHIKFHRSSAINDMHTRIFYILLSSLHAPLKLPTKKTEGQNKPVVALVPVDRNTNGDRSNEVDWKSITHPEHKTKRCKSLTPLRKVRLSAPLKKVNNDGTKSQSGNAMDKIEVAFPSSKIKNISPKTWKLSTSTYDELIDSNPLSRFAKNIDDYDEEVSTARRPREPFTPQKKKKYLCLCLDEECAKKEPLKSFYFGRNQPAPKLLQNADLYSQIDALAASHPQEDLEEHQRLPLIYRKQGSRRLGDKRLKHKKCQPVLVACEPTDNPTRIRLPLRVPSNRGSLRLTERPFHPLDHNYQGLSLAESKHNTPWGSPYDIYQLPPPPMDNSQGMSELPHLGSPYGGIHDPCSNPVFSSLEECVKFCGRKVCYAAMNYLSLPKDPYPSEYYNQPDHYQTPILGSPREYGCDNDLENYGRSGLVDSSTDYVMRLPDGEESYGDESFQGANSNQEYSSLDDDEPFVESSNDDCSEAPPMKSEGESDKAPQEDLPRLGGAHKIIVQPGFTHRTGQEINDAADADGDSAQTSSFEKYSPGDLNNDISDEVEVKGAQAEGIGLETDETVETPLQETPQNDPGDVDEENCTYPEESTEDNPNSGNYGSQLGVTAPSETAGNVYDASGITTEEVSSEPSIIGKSYETPEASVDYSNYQKAEAPVDPPAPAIGAPKNPQQLVFSDCPLAEPASPSANQHLQDLEALTGLSIEDSKLLRGAIYEAINRVASNRKQEIKPNKVPSSCDIIGAPEPEKIPGLGDNALLKNLFHMPEVRNLVLGTVKALIPQLTGTSRDSGLGKLTDSIVGKSLNVVVGEEDPPEDSVEPSLGLVNENAESIPDQIIKILTTLINQPGVGLDNARLPGIQNIIVRTLEGVLRRSKNVVDNAIIWEALNDILNPRGPVVAPTIRRPTAKNVVPPKPTLPPPDFRKDKVKMKPLGFFPVTEHYIENGEWRETSVTIGYKGEFPKAMIPEYLENDVENVGAARKADGEEDNAPIKYHSPQDIVLQYIKNHPAGEANVDASHLENDADDCVSEEPITGDQSQNCDDVADSAVREPGSIVGSPVSNPIYFGKITAPNAGSLSSISDLEDSDLLYIGDGVKLPLTIKRTADGSLTLMLSEKICQSFLQQNCPCCVPQQGGQVRYSRRAGEEENSREIRPTTVNDNEAIDSLMSEEPPVVTMMPVEKFVEKYNLTLNSKDNAIVSSWRDKNFKLGKREEESELNDSADGEEETDDTASEESDDEGKGTRSTFDKDQFIHDILSLQDSPENNQAAVVINMIDDLLTLRSEESSREKGKPDGFGYQKDNPFLRRMKKIEDGQSEHGRYKYQRNLEGTTRVGMDVAKDVLQWLKELIIQSTTTEMR